MVELEIESESAIAAARSAKEDLDRERLRLRRDEAELEEARRKLARSSRPGLGLSEINPAFERNVAEIRARVDSLGQAHTALTEEAQTLGSLVLACRSELEARGIEYKNAEVAMLSPLRRVAGDAR